MRSRIETEIQRKILLGLLGSVGIDNTSILHKCPHQISFQLLLVTQFAKPDLGRVKCSVPLLGAHLRSSRVVYYMRIVLSSRRHVGVGAMVCRSYGSVTGAVPVLGEVIREMFARLLS